MRRVPDSRTAVALRVSGPWWNSFLAVAPKPHLSHVSAYQRRSRPPTCGPRMSAVAVDSLMVLRLYQGVGLPRLCGTPCRLMVSWVEPHRSIHIRHAAIALAIIVSTDAETHRAAPAFALVDRSLLRARPSGGTSDSWVESSVISPLIFRDTWLI